MNFAFPFPNKNLALQELSYDALYDRIPLNDRQRIVDEAWKKGETAAEVIFYEYDGLEDFVQIVKNEGLMCNEIQKDYVVGNTRYFCDFISGQKVINLYLGSISLWAQENDMELESAKQIILSHEYYHFLETTRFGLTSRIYQLPMLTIGKLKIGKVGIRTLSEIGAHAFAHTYYQKIKEGKNGKS